MRIDLYNSATTELASEQASKKAATGNSASSGLSSAEDRATLTSDSTSVGSLVSTALRSPVVRQSLVDSLKQSVNSGEYQLNPAKIAASIVDDHA
jgi:flagellar biosynthesis anti-sigma factor FlgM